MTLDGRDIRPTAEKIRGAVFNMMAPYVEDAVFLDGFAGSGAMGIEALSRGAQRSFFVDCHAKSIEVLKKNLINLDLKAHSCVVKDNFFNFIKKTDVKFDIIFTDPPYAMQEVTQMVLSVASADVLRLGGFLIVEHAQGVALEPDEQLVLVKQKKYSDTVISIFERT